MITVLGVIETWHMLRVFFCPLSFFPFFFWCVFCTEKKQTCSCESLRSTLQYGTSSQCEPGSGTSLKKSRTSYFVSNFLNSGKQR